MFEKTFQFFSAADPGLNAEERLFSKYVNERCLH